jgi:predicted ferric reductase
MKEDFWFYLLAAIIILITGAQAAITYKRRRVIHNLITLIANIVIFIGIILVYFYQWDFLNGIGSVGVQISLMVVIGILILFSLFYQEIIHIFHKGKIKKK